MIIKSLTVGPIMANCFILGCDDTKEAVVIDPGDDINKILLALSESKLTVKKIINTHGHFDHVGANKDLKNTTGAELLIHKADAPMLEELNMAASAFGMSVENSPPADAYINDGDIISFGNMSIKVLHTPGHSPGSVSLLVENECVFAGDTLFAGSIGRTDLPGGSYDTLISAVKEKLFTLDDNIKVYCGHGPETTIGREKQYNPFF